MAVEQDQNNRQATTSVETFSEEEFLAFQKKNGIKEVKMKDGGVKRLSCAGMDVHKKILVVAACITNPETLVPVFHVFKTVTQNADMHAMCNWLRSLNIKDVCMESSGKYWIPIYNFLEKEGFNPVLTHPKYVKSPRGKKNDVQDAMHIANCFRMGNVLPSFIPPEDIRDMRELCRYRIKLTYVKTSEKNRYQNSLQVCNIRLDNVFKDVFGTSCQKLMDIVLSEGFDTIDEARVKSLLHKHCKSSAADILDSIRGGEFIGSQHLLIQLYQYHIDDVDFLIYAIDQVLGEYREKYRRQIDIVTSIVGISEKAAIYILAEIGCDMNIWTSHRGFSSWCGVVPASNSSANKNKSTRIGPGGYYLKPILVQCANAAIKSTKQPYFAIKYRKIKSHRGHNKAIIAIAHKMMICIFHMLKDDTFFCPKDLDAVLNQANKTSKKKDISLDALQDILKAKGLDDESIQMIIGKCKAAEASDEQATTVAGKEIKNGADTDGTDAVPSVGQMDGLEGNNAVADAALGEDPVPQALPVDAGNSPQAKPKAARKTRKKTTASPGSSDKKADKTRRSMVDGAGNSRLAAKRESVLDLADTVRSKIASGTHASGTKADQEASEKVS